MQKAGSFTATVSYISITSAIISVQRDPTNLGSCWSLPQRDHTVAALIVKSNVEMTELLCNVTVINYAKHVWTVPSE